MKLNIICFFILSLGLIAPTSKAATVSTQIVLLDASDTPLPHVGNTYVIPLGTNFRVMVQGQVNDPYFTDNARVGTAMDNQPLGIIVINARLGTSGVNIVNPDQGPPGGFDNTPSWLNFVEYLGQGIPGFTNLIDFDYDGDLDPAGAGTGSASLSLSSAFQLPFVQLGAFGMANLFEGTYTAVGSGITQLSLVEGQAYVYRDPVNANNSLESIPVSPIIDAGGPLTIIVPVPEPSTYAVAGFGLLGLAVAMRRNNVRD